MSVTFSHRLEVRFRDCDALGHTNNAVYLTYLEQARFAHWRSLWGGDLPGIILARVEADYKRPSYHGDVLDVRLRIAAVGRSSFRYEYEIVNEQGETVLNAKTVQVMYDYTTNRPVPIPDAIRARLAPAGSP